MLTHLATKSSYFHQGPLKPRFHTKGRFAQTPLVVISRAGYNTDNLSYGATLKYPEPSSIPKP